MSMGVMCLPEGMYCTLTDTICVPLGTMCSHRGTFCTLTNRNYDLYIHGCDVLPQKLSFYTSCQAFFLLIGSNF